MENTFSKTNRNMAIIAVMIHVLDISFACDSTSRIVKLTSEALVALDYSETLFKLVLL